MNIQQLISQLNYTLSEGRRTPEAQVFLWIDGDRQPLDCVDIMPIDDYHYGGTVDLNGHNPEFSDEPHKQMNIDDLIKGLTLAATYDHLDEKSGVFLYADGVRYMIDYVDLTTDLWYIDLNANVL